MSATARERVLEKKIVTLEQRLVLVERFVEMRFCETFRDFQTRNISSGSGFNDEDDDQSKTKPRGSKDPKAPTGGKKTRGGATVGMTNVERDNSSSVQENAPPPHQEEESRSESTYRTRYGRQTRRPAGKFGDDSGASSTTQSTPKPSTSSGGNDAVPISGKILRVCVPRLDDIPNTVDELSRTKAEEFTETTVIKIHYETEEEDQCLEDQDGDGNNGDEYFTFASGEDENTQGADPGQGNVPDGEEQDQDDAADPTDEDWNAPAGDEDDYEEDEDDARKAKVKRKSTTLEMPTPRKKPKKRCQKKRIKERVPARLDLIPEGVRVLPLDPTGTKECPVCHKHYKSEIFEQHLETHVKERHLKCPYCEKRFFTNNSLYSHKRKHLTQKYGRACRLCSKLFVERFKVLYHERSCIRKRLEENIPVDPDILEDVRNRSKNVDLRWPDPNEKIPEGMKKCGHCKRLIAEDLFLSHLRELHASWKCSICDAKFTSKSGLVRHLMKYHGKNRVTCEICGELFESRKDYRNHFHRCPEGGRRNYTRRLKNRAKADPEKLKKLLDEVKAREQGAEQGGESMPSLPEDMDTPPAVENEEVIVDEEAAK